MTFILALKIVGLFVLFLIGGFLTLVGIGLVCLVFLPVPDERPRKPYYHNGEDRK